MSAYFACCNRNKRSLAIDLRSPRARPLVEALVRRADVLVENYRTGGAEALGVGYEAMAALNPRLVYCSISGYGRDGPQATRPGYDFVVQAEAGLMAITGPADGEPAKVGVAVADLATGQNAATAILAALLQRERTGAGPAHRHLAVRHPAGMAGQHRQQRAVHRRGAPSVAATPTPASCRTRAFRASDRRLRAGRGQRKALGAGLRRAGPRRSRRRPALRQQRRARARTAWRCAPNSPRCSPPHPRRTGWRCSTRAGVPAGPINSVAPGAGRTRWPPRAACASKWTASR